MATQKHVSKPARRMAPRNRGRGRGAGRAGQAKATSKAKAKAKGRAKTEPQPPDPPSTLAVAQTSPAVSAPMEETPPPMTPADFAKLSVAEQTALLESLPNPSAADYRRFHKELATSADVPDAVKAEYQEIMARKHKVGATVNKERDLRRLAKRFVWAREHADAAESVWTAELWVKSESMERKQKYSEKRWGCLGGALWACMAAARSRRTRRTRAAKSSRWTTQTTIWMASSTST